MRVQTLQLENFRNHQKTTLKLGPQLTILVGPNTSGKTNILEAFHFLTGAHSWRAAKEFFLIKHNESFAKVFATLVNTSVLPNTKTRPNYSRTVVGFLSLKNGRAQRQFRLQGIAINTSTLARSIPMVIFKPDDLDEIIHNAAARRTWLDNLIVKSENTGADLYGRYRRIIQQRLRALEQTSEGEIVDLNSLDEQLCQYGAQITLLRLKALRELSRKFTDTYNNIAQEEKNMALQLISKTEMSLSGDIAEIQQGYARACAQLRKQEVAARRNLVGPHRDDVGIFQGPQLLQETGSRGEWRTAVVALKIGELEYLEQKNGERPLLLIDDVLSELDQSRRAALTEIFLRQQTVLTTTNLSELPKRIQVAAQIYQIDQGAVHLGAPQKVYAET